MPGGGVRSRSGAAYFLDSVGNMIMRHDLRGVSVSSGSTASLASYETALRQFQSYVGDPIATLDAALAEDPDFIAGHLFRALALFTVAERKYIPEVLRSLREANSRAANANDRERGLMVAVDQLCAGQWHAACRTLDRVLIDNPRDALALQAGHLLDFYRGDALNLRNRVTRVLPHWDASVPGYSYVLGMHAFGLEEMNQYPEAEQQALRALAMEPKDGWAVHAGTHVMEMQGRIGEGVAWLESRESDWGPDNAFAFHNYWHLALFQMDGGQYDRALALYDAKIHPAPATILLTLIDATALLWRLTLDGADVGDRFEHVAGEWEAQLEAESGYYAFNDVHAALAFVATGRTPALDRLATGMARAAAGSDANAAMSRDVGIPLAQGFEAFGRGRYADAIAALEPVRDVAQRFGGSHAQRDIVTLTLIEAAIRAGDRTRADHYIAERLVHKPGSAWGPRLAQRAAAAGGATERRAVA